MSNMSYQLSTRCNKDAVIVLCEMVRQHLGINGSMRCIVAGDERDEVYVKSTVDILKCLDIQHPAGVYVMKICQGHKDVYGCGVKSLLFFIGQLCSQVQILMEQGVPLVYIEELLNEAVDCCMENLQPVTIPVTISSTSDVHHVQPQGPSRLFTLPLSASSNGYSYKDHSGSGLECHHFCPQNIRYPHDFSHFQTSAKETVPGTSHVDEFDIDETVNPVRTDKRTCKLGLNKEGTIHENSPSSRTTSGLHLSSGLKSSCLNTPLKSFTVVNSKNTGSSVTVSALNDFLHYHKKPSSSTKRYKTVMLGSRHLRDCGSLDEDTNCHVSEPVATKILSVNREKHLDHHPHIHELSSATGVLTKLKSVTNEIKCCLEKTKTAKGDQMSVDGRIVFLPKEAESLSHGNLEMMSWAEKAMCYHLFRGRHSKFDISLIHTVCVSGRHGAHQLLDGLAVGASLDVMETVSRIDHPTSVLLVNGDLTAEFKHKGHKAALSTVQVTDSVQSLHHHPQSWSTQVFDLLKQLEVHVVLVRGTVNADLHMACMADGIALVDHVSFHALKVLQSACGVDLVTYILDAHQNNICCDISLKPLQEDWCNIFNSIYKHLVITPPVFVQTMVISEPSLAGREVREEEFWHCAARLRQAMEDRKVLQGGGLTEELCAHHLRTHLNHPDGGGKASVGTRWPGEVSLYRPVVRAALADVFLAFARNIHHNRQTAGCDTHSQQNVCDGLNPARCNTHSQQNVYDGPNPAGCNTHKQQNVCDGSDSHYYSVGLATGHCRHCSLFRRFANSHCCKGFSSSGCRNTARDSHLKLHESLMLESCQNNARDPSHEPVDSQILKTCQKSSSTKLYFHPCETQSAGEDYQSTSHSVPVQSCYICNRQNCTETHSASSFLQDMGRDPDLGDPAQALDNHQCCGQCGDSLCKHCQKASAAKDSGHTESVWDNYSSKVNSWRSAVQCVCMVMRMNDIIVTGVDQQTKPIHTVLL